MFDKVQFVTNFIHNTDSGTIEEKQAVIQELIDHPDGQEHINFLKQIHFNLGLELHKQKIDKLSIKQRLLYGL